MEAYQGYFEGGQIIPIGNPKIPEGRRIIITVLDEPAPESRASKQREAFEEFIKDIEAVQDEPLGEEFDQIISQRFNITRELDL